MSEETQFGIEVDGNFVTLVEVLDGVAVSSRSHYFEDIEEGIELITTGLKKGKREPSYRVSVAVPKSAMRRIDVTKSLADRRNFENYVYEKTSANKDLTTLSGMFFDKDRMEGDNVSAGVAVLAPKERVDSVYYSFREKDIELVLPALTYNGFNGIWLAIRYEVSDVTLIENGKPVAYRQLQNAGGLSQLISILGDEDNRNIGPARLEAALKRSGVSDPLAESEVDRFLRKIVVELQQTLKFWENSGEKINQEILVLGPGARNNMIEKALAEAGLKRVFPKKIQDNLAFLPLEERDLSLGALCAASTLGYDMPEVAFINSVKAKIKEEKKASGRRNNAIKRVLAASLIVVLTGGGPYLYGMKLKASADNRLKMANENSMKSNKNIMLSKELTARSEFSKIIEVTEPDWTKALGVSLDYSPAGLTIDNLQATRDKSIITITVTSSVPGSSYNLLASWLDKIKVNGGASTAWISSFSFNNGKTNSQITYTLPIGKVIYKSLEDTVPGATTTNSEANSSLTINEPAADPAKQSQTGAFPVGDNSTGSTIIKKGGVK